MTMIIPMILERFREKLELTLITNIPEDDPTRAYKVKIGRFQDDPTRNSIYVSINGGDPDDPNYRDGIITLQEMQNIGFNAPAREVGGGQLWWRRGILQIGCYFVVDRYPEATALDYAYTVLGRIESVLETTYLSDLMDDHGERAIAPFLFANTFFESGGPPSDYIWRGKVQWSVLTERK